MWKDGILTHFVRKAVQEKGRHWVICDGPIDAIWVESMNSVLDDNKKLILASGELISLSPSTRMLFEVQDLAVASPATVSRVGIVYMEPETLGLRLLLDSWVQRRTHLSKGSSVRIQHLF